MKIRNKLTPYEETVMIRRLIILLLIVGCEEVLESINEGCTTTTACNYNADAGKDDGSCVAPQGCNEWCAGGTDTTSIALELDCMYGNSLIVLE